VEGVRGRTHEGTGIGLALVQELTKLHGGTVRAESVCGKGSTFTVTIPLGTGHLPADRLRAERTISSTALGGQPYVAEALRWLPDVGGGGDVGSGMERPILPEPPLLATGSPGERARILFADDNADMRDYVRRLLSPRYDVRVVATGEEALAVLRAEPRCCALSVPTRRWPICRSSFSQLAPARKRASKGWKQVSTTTSSSLLGPVSLPLASPAIWRRHSFAANGDRQRLSIGA